MLFSNVEFIPYRREYVDQPPNVCNLYTLPWDASDIWLLLVLQACITLGELKDSF